MCIEEKNIYTECVCACKSRTDYLRILVLEGFPVQNSRNPHRIIFPLGYNVLLCFQGPLQLVQASIPQAIWCLESRAVIKISLARGQTKLDLNLVSLIFWLRDLRKIAQSSEFQFPHLMRMIHFTS